MSRLGKILESFQSVNEGKKWSIELVFDCSPFEKQNKSGFDDLVYLEVSLPVDKYPTVRHVKNWISATYGSPKGYKLDYGRKGLLVPEETRIR